MVKLSKELSEAFIDGRGYLEQNDLNKFYYFLYMRYLESEVLDEEIADATLFLLQNGVDPMDYISGSIPQFFCMGLKGSACPPSLMDEGTLVFPDKIKVIKQCAFDNTDGYDVLDLRGIDHIEMQSFSNSDIQIVYLDKNVTRKSLGEYSLRNNPIEIVHFHYSFAGDTKRMLDILGAGRNDGPFSPQQLDGLDIGYWE